MTISGNIYRHDRKNQKPQAEFEKFVQAMLDDPFIRSFGWRQYTPYFNDGDTCVFSAGGLWVLTTADPEDAEVGGWDDEYNIDAYSTHPTLGGYEDKKYVGSHEDSYASADKLSDAVENGEFDNVLLNLFGDHASVTITRDGITVDTCEHD